jgi:hypothetical protein
VVSIVQSQPSPSYPEHPPCGLNSTVTTLTELFIASKKLFLGFLGCPTAFLETEIKYNSQKSTASVFTNWFKTFYNEVHMASRHMAKLEKKF